MEPEENCVPYYFNTEVLVGDLQGVDLLLGMDWLIDSNAHIDFGQMRVRVGSKSTIKLETDPYTRSRARIYQVFGEKIPKAMQQPYVRLVDKQTIPSGYTSKLTVKAIGYWPAFTSGVFEGHVQLGPGIEIIDCLVQPDDGSREFAIGIANRTTS